MRSLFFGIWNLKIWNFKRNGGLAQLARAPALHAGGQRFDSVILHKLEEQVSKKEITNANYWNLGFKKLEFSQSKSSLTY